MMPNSDVLKLLDKLAAACRILEMEGHGDMSLGHVAIRDPAGRGFWMKRNRMALAEILGPDDFVLLDFGGRQLAGEGRRHSEWPIHGAILAARGDVVATAHTHAFHASVFSASTQPLKPYTLDADYFSELPRHRDDVALITKWEEGEALARSLGDHFAVLMANHGVTFCGTSIEHMTCVGIFLEKACRAQLIGDAARLEATFPSPEIRARRNSQIMTAVHVEHSWNYFMRKLHANESARGRRAKRPKSPTEEKPAIRRRAIQQAEKSDKM